MAFTPRTRDELARLVLGSIVSRTALTDTSQGSVVDTISQAFGAVSASIERQIEKARDAFDLRNATGAELDERLKEFPLETITRKEATLARGHLELSFNPALTANLTIEEGSTFARSDNPSVIYSTTQEYIVQAGQNAFAVEVEANLDGIEGNCAKGLITTILSAPSEITSVNNTGAFTNGLEQETDTQLKRRALLYLKSLARCQPSALEYGALSLSSTQGRLILASIYEDPYVLGYSELAIDDGSGKLGENKRAGKRYIMTAGNTGGVRTFYHEAPAVNNVTLATISNNVETPLDPTKYLSIPERGVIYIDEGAISANQTFTVQYYEVYTGLIAEVQDLIEGDINNPLSKPAFRACGTRVRVVPPSVLTLDCDIHLIPKSGFDFETVQKNVKDAFIQKTLDLKLGQPLYTAQLINEALMLGSVLSLKIYVADTGDTDNPILLDDIYPAQNQVVRIGTLNILPTPEDT